MREEMVRYSKSPDKQHRKNTLVTLQDGDVIYFGIARCNYKAGDMFYKVRGKVIAKARAIRAKLDFNPAILANADIVLHENNLRGCCPKSKIRDLLKYFDDIDTIMKETW